MVDHCYSSVTAQSFIQQTKDNTPLRHEGEHTPKERVYVHLLMTPLKHLQFSSNQLLSHVRLFATP